MPPAVDPRVERTRDVVVGYVRELVQREGLQAVTPQRVAEETGVSRSTIHRHWPDRRSLLLDALAEPDHVADTPLLGDLRLDLGVDLHQLRLTLEKPEAVGLVVCLLSEATFDTGFAEVLRIHARAHLDRLARVIAAGQDAGKLRRDIDVESAMATLAGPLVFRRLILGQDVTPEFVESVVDGFIAAHAAH